ncbi:MAG: ABC transporter ATP-binding protein [Sphaerochaetaceae bacterium]|nr:ABC transporter ATP-binding protein [Sphaerochaetaceae bacterium]
MNEYAIEMMHITKVFPGIKANDDIVVQVKHGEIFALLGENGAGKSTLVSVLFGLYQPDEGQILLEGKPVEINNPRDANKLGIGMVHQHFMLVKKFTVLENIILGVETVKNTHLQLDEARKKVMKLSENYGLKVRLDEYVSDISVGMQQRVEILKMLYRNNDILIFDEPTAVLTPQEIEELMEIMVNLKKEGKSIVFITHKLNEIKQIADRCAVLRRGKCIGTVDVKDVSPEQMSEMMVGRKIETNLEKKPFNPGELILDVQNLSVVSNRNKEKNVLNEVTFQLHRGEILCIAGIEGNGQSELALALYGLLSHSNGKIILGGKDISNSSIRKRSLDGLAMIPEDRHKHGLVLDYTLEENLILKKYFNPEFQKHGFIDFNNREKFADGLIKRFDVRCGNGRKSKVRSMSGGNQQKAIIAREIDLDTDVIIAMQPTRGLDVGAIEYIHKQLLAQRDSGKAVLLISFELEEVMNISDRILVLYEGEIVANVLPHETTVNEIGLFMAGSKRSVKK